MGINPNPIFQPKPYDPAPPAPPSHNNHTPPPSHNNHTNNCYTPPTHTDSCHTHSNHSVHRDNCYSHSNHNNNCYSHSNYTPPEHYDSCHTYSDYNDSCYTGLPSHTDVCYAAPPPPVYTGAGKVAGRVDNNALNVTMDAKTFMDYEVNVEKIVVNTSGDVGKRKVNYKEVRKDKGATILGSAEGVNGKEVIDLKVDFSKDGKKLFAGAIAGRKTSVSITGSAGKFKIGGVIGDEKVDVDMELKKDLCELSGKVGASTVKFNLAKSGQVDSTFSLVPLLGFTNSGKIIGSVGDSILNIAMDARLVKDEKGKISGAVTYTRGEIGKRTVDYKEVRGESEALISGSAIGVKGKEIIDLRSSTKDGKKVLSGLIAGKKAEVSIEGVGNDQYKVKGLIGDKKVEVNMKTKGALVELSGKVGTLEVKFNLTRKNNVTSMFSLVPLLGFIE